MSSGVQDTPNYLRNCPQSAGEDLDPEDLSVTPSSILYLLQEATKLTTPSSQFSLGGEGLRPKEKTVSMSITCSPKAQKENAQPSFTRTFSVLKNIPTSSPWEVMSLINLQCEQLLHCGQIRGEEGDFYTCTSKTDDAEHTDVMESSSAGLTEGPSTVFSGEESAEREAQSDVCWSVPHVIDATDQMFSNQSVDEDGDSGKTEAIEGLAELISKSTAEISYFSSEESSENCFLGQTSMVSLVEAEHVDVCGPPCHTQEGEVADDLSRPVSLQTPNELSSVDFTSSLVDEKDVNSSLWFAFNEHDTPESQVAVVSKTTPQSPQSDCASLPRTDLNNNLELQVHEEASSAQSSWGSRRRTPRKQAHPARSPDLQDPELQGVTFSMQTEIDHSTDQCRLLITSNYSDLCRRGRRSRSSRSRSGQSSQRPISSEEESDPASISKKICASCRTRKTPLWRDAEDGTPLCNACGIRYKKYGVRCLQCWSIPRKEASSNSRCSNCGDQLQLASQNKRSGWEDDMLDI